MKIATNAISTQVSSKSGINKFGYKAVAAMVKVYEKIDKVTMEGKPFFTIIDPDTLSYEDNRVVV